MTTATAPSTALTIVDRVEQSPAIQMLQDRSQALLDLLPDQSAVDRFQRIVIQAMIKNPDLLSCTPDSVVVAVFEAAGQGLEPTGAAGGAHLVPYVTNGTKVAQLIPDYRGVIRMVTKPGSEVLSLEARVVKEGDEFRYNLGTDAFVDHVPALDPGRSARATTHAYAVARLRNGSTIPDVEDRAGIERVQKRTTKSSKSPWATDWDEMAKKTMIKRLAKVLPVRPDVRTILMREDEFEDVPTPPALPDGPTRTDRLASRLRNVTPDEPAQDASGDADLVDAVFTPVDAPDAPAEDGVGLVTAIREAAERSALAGDITAAQKTALKPLIELVGKDEFRSVAQAAFGPDALAAPTAAIVEGILTVTDSFDSEAALVAAWQAAAA